MSVAAQLAAVQRLLVLTTTATNIALELRKLAALLERAHAEGRTLTEAEMEEMDRELTEAQAAAHAARPPG